MPLQVLLECSLCQTFLATLTSKFHTVSLFAETHITMVQFSKNSIKLLIHFSEIHLNPGILYGSSCFNILPPFRENKN